MDLSSMPKCYLRNHANDRDFERNWPGALTFMFFRQLGTK